MDGERVKKFIELIQYYNREPNKRVFRVDRDCYIIFTGFSALDEKPFIRIGYSNYIEKFKQHISNVIIAVGYLSSISEEIKQIESDEFETNFIVPSSIYNVILKFLPSTLHHKVNVNVIDKAEEEKEASKVIKEISEKYKSYVLLYSDGNFAVTFSGRKIFDLFSAIVNDLTSSKILNLLSAKLYDILPNNAIIKVGGNYIIRSKKGETLIATDEFDTREFIKYPIPITSVKTLIGNDVISLIDTVRLIYDRSRLKILTNKSTYEDFKKFTLGIRFVEVSEKINIISNVNIVSSENKYYIPLVDRDGKEKVLVFGKTESKNKIQLDNLEYMLLENFSKHKLTYFSTDLLLKDPEERDFHEEFNKIKDTIKEIFNKRITISDIEKDFESDKLRIANDRKRLEELISIYTEISKLPYSEKLEILVKSEKLEGTQKEKEIREFAQKVSSESLTTKKTLRKSYQEEISRSRSAKSRKFLGIDLKYLLISLGVIILLVGGVLLIFKDEITSYLSGPLTKEEQKLTHIISNLENIYEPELTEVQKELGITITDYDIWVYVNKVAVINGYKPLTYRNPQKWEDPDWVYPGNKLKLLDDSVVVVREGDNMWNISKRKIIEDYIKKNFNVTVRSKGGTNFYKVRKR
ncbi:MAG: hypothetical protein ABDH28_03290 [Brevinematia bacterium]